MHRTVGQERLEPPVDRTERVAETLGRPATDRCSGQVPRARRQVPAQGLRRHQPPIQQGGESRVESRHLGRQRQQDVGDADRDLQQDECESQAEQARERTGRGSPAGDAGGGDGECEPVRVEAVQQMQPLRALPARGSTGQSGLH